ncbi:unnamed protein product, partial [Pocillopora meandrina]
NEATRQRRIAIKSYWKSKSDHLKEKPADFYRTFMPFLGSNARARSTEFNIKVGNEIVKNPDKVAETLANYFASIADGIDMAFEQIVAKQLVGMFDYRLGQALSAYWKTHSCETTLINLIENWRHARDNKHLVGT